jgi:prepilin-type N-terminal cleavage/methylation domain-containing protein
MRTAGNKAFTLVELLIVILLIGILTTLVVPSVIRAVELARQAVCNSNVQKIVAGLVQYSTDSEAMPKVPVSSWDTRIGTNLNTNPFGGNSSRNHSANLWLLVREGHVNVAAFVCPSSTDIKSEYQKVKKYWDFGSSRYISYGLQSPYGYGGSLSVIMPDGVVIVADGSPYVQTSQGDDPGKLRTGRIMVADWADDGQDGDQMQFYGNSPNHEMEGQNVGYITGNAQWKTAANCGKDGDNIYSANGKSGSAVKTATSPGGKLAPNIRNNKNDTLILP